MPTFRATTGGFRITNREYIKDIISSSTAGSFKRESFAINPALSSTFPWLAVLASNFESYNIRGMVFQYRSLSGESVAAANTSLGSVIMATEYNASSAPYSSKQQMEQSQFAQSVKPSENAQHGIEANPSQTVLRNLFTRGGAVIGQDLKFYDHGIFQIATQGLQAASVSVGELWVCYDIEFLKPQIPITPGGLENTSRIRVASVPTAGSVTATDAGWWANNASGIYDATVGNITVTGQIPLTYYGSAQAGNITGKSGYQFPCQPGQIYKFDHYVQTPAGLVMGTVSSVLTNFETNVNIPIATNGFPVLTTPGGYISTVTHVAGGAQGYLTSIFTIPAGVFSVLYSILPGTLVIPAGGTAYQSTLITQIDNSVAAN